MGKHPLFYPTDLRATLEAEIERLIALCATLETEIERLIALCDALDGDADFEPDADGEPWLASFGG